MERLPDFVETERLVVRRLTEDDAAVIEAAVDESREHLRPWMPWVADEPLEPEARREMLRSWKELWESGTDCHLGVFRDEALVGIVGAHRRIGPGGVELGYWAHVDHTGQGYITEAAAAVTSACFQLDDVDRVQIHHDHANAASGAVPRRLGYTRVSEHPDEIAAPGEVGIKVVWRVEREEWVGD